MRSHGVPACKMLGTNPSLPAGHCKCPACKMLGTNPSLPAGHCKCPVCGVI